MTGGAMTRDEILRWLSVDDAAALAPLWAEADAVRRAHVGDAVHLRGLVEISNHCVRGCLYCGLRGASDVTRYRMTHDEILACARDAARFGYGTLVMQSGEDPGLGVEFVAGVVRAVKAETGLAVTLSLGERTVDAYRAWKDAGADRVLLRFETSDPALYDVIHPHGDPGSRAARSGRGKPRPYRVDLLLALRELGYEIGSGVMVGIPGQTWDTLADDIALFATLDLDMIGVGPFLPSPRTPLGDDGGEGVAARLRAAAGAEQVPNDELTTLKVVALTRLACPAANIPSTTALATIDPAAGRELGLQRGANVVMPNVTPPRYRVLYEIYPGKACIHETATACRGCLEGRIARIGRVVGRGPGGRART